MKKLTLIYCILLLSSSSILLAWNGINPNIKRDGLTPDAAPVNVVPASTITAAPAPVASTSTAVASNSVGQKIDSIIAEISTLVNQGATAISHAIQFVYTHRTQIEAAAQQAEALAAKLADYKPTSGQLTINDIPGIVQALGTKAQTVESWMEQIFGKHSSNKDRFMNPFSWLKGKFPASAFKKILAPIQAQFDSAMEEIAQQLGILTNSQQLATFFPKANIQSDLKLLNQAKDTINKFVKNATKNKTISTSKLIDAFENIIQATKDLAANPAATA